MASYPRVRTIAPLGILLLSLGSLCLSKVARANDPALRSFLGVSSLKLDLPVAQEDRYFAVAVGKFENGKFIGYALPPQMGLSIAQTPSRSAEFAWRKLGKTSECVLTADGISRATGTDDFISKFQGRTKEVSGSSQGFGEFRGFRVVSYLSAVPADADERAPLPHFEESIEDFPTIALLYKEFSRRSDYLAFVEELERSLKQ